MAELSSWPTGRPSDESASQPMACTPAEPRVPTRLGDDVTVDAEGELVFDADKE